MRLNLLALQTDRSADAGGGRLDVGLFGNGRGPMFSRRSLFGWVGTTTVGSFATAKALEAAVLGRYEVVQRRGRVVFRLGGEDRWVIDVRCFGGRPRLEVGRHEGVLRVDLRNAFLPGTKLPADLVCEIRSALVGSHMRLRLLASGFDGFVPFERWLMGYEMCRSVVRQDSGTLGVSIRAGVKISLSGLARFEPDWSLKVVGHRVAHLEINGRRFSADAARLSLSEPASPTVFEKPMAKRALISLERGPDEWPLGPLLPRPARGRLTGADGCFDAVHMELGESRSGQMTAALVAEVCGEKAELGYEPGRNLKAVDGSRFQLPLERPRFAMLLSGSEPEAALLARLSDRPVWLQTNGCRLMLRGSATTPPFQLLRRGGRQLEMICEPALGAAVAALPGATSGFLRPRREARLAFVTTSAAPQSAQVKPRRPTVQLRPKPKDAEEVSPESPDTEDSDLGEIRLGRDEIENLILPANLIVPVVRPQDLLALDFEFINLSLDIDGSHRLVRKDPSKAAHIVAHFPPQNVAEQAFFEVAEEFPPERRRTAQPDQRIQRRVDPNHNRSSADTLPTPPVESRVSGPSRLVFRVPTETASIDYTLDALLDACSSFPLQVAANAVPPDPPLLTTLFRKTLRILGAEPRIRRSIEVEPRREVRRPEAESGSTRVRTVPKTGAMLARLPRAPSPPEPHETAIEMPYRLIVSPHGESGWAHAREPVQGKSGRYELWHTRLGVRADDGSVDEEEQHYRTIRAIWSPDYKPARFQGRPPLHFGAEPEDPEGNPFRASLDSRDRHEIVALTADFSGALKYLKNGSATPYTPLPVRVGRLLLTSLGAWLDSRGAWEPPVDTGIKETVDGLVHDRGLALTVEEWRHQATMARDHYVRVVYKGFLFPFRHRASLIKVTERKFQPIETGPLTGKIAAFLRQRMYIVVREPEITYDYSGLPEADRRRAERRNPFKQVRITTLTTPSLNKPEESDVAAKSQAAFWPRVSGKDFLFHLVARDWKGERVDFSAPLLFIGADLVGNKDFMREDVLPLYSPEELAATGSGTVPDAERQEAEKRRLRSLDGQKIAYAETATAPTDNGSESDNATLETASITFGATVPGLADPGFNPAPGAPIFYPILSRAEVRIPAVAAIVGSSQPSTVKYSDIYADNDTENGFGGPKNKGEIFAELIAPTQLLFPAEKSGGLATPNINIAGLSRRFGPVGAKFDGPPDLSGLAAGKFDPADFFGGADAKILGGIDLWDIIAPKWGGGGNVPKLTTSVVYPGGDKSKPPEATRADLFWQPEVQKDPGGIFVPGGGSTLTLRAHIIKRFDAKEPETSIEGELTDFAIDLIGNVESFLIVNFDHIRFSSRSGEAMNVDPKISGVELAGPLKFIRELADFLPQSGFNIDVSPEGVKAGLSIGLPAVTSGHVNLFNISLNAGLLIPFSGDPVRLRFAFCERDNPFALTVYCFGGGGFVALALGLDGVETLEVALEFGATVSLDLGVASGGLYAMAGIYMALEGDKCALSGYLRMGGELEILALITISIEFYMSLTYEPEENKVWGEAKVTVEVEILMVSVPVELSVRREFFDPELNRFDDWMSEPQWVEYCDAFAA